MDITQLHKAGIYIDPMTEIQRKFLFDYQHRFFVLSPGRRARKTIIAINKIFNSASEAEGKYFFGAPTRKQAKAIFWERIKKYAKAAHFLETKPSESDLEFRLKNGSLIRVVGLDSAERIEGETPSWNGALITEAPNLKEVVWEEHVRPVFADTNGFCILDGTPDLRHQWHYELSSYAAGGRIPSPEPEIGAFSENPLDPEWCFYSWLSSDVLDAEEIEKLKKSYDPKIFRQEFEGSYEKSGGIVYHAYSQENETDAVYDPLRMTYLAFDFNVNPMTCIVIQETGHKEYAAVKEFVLHDSNTRATGEAVAEYLKDQKAFVEITGDASGHSRRTVGAGATSDWVILEQIFKNFPGYRKRVKFSNPSIKNRVNALNGLFCNMMGEIRFRVNPNECPYLHKDLTRQTYKEDGTLNDSGNIGHRSDAIGYFADNYHPMATKREIYKG